MTIIEATHWGASHMSTGVIIIVLTFSALFEEGITWFNYYFFFIRKLAVDQGNGKGSYDIIYFWFLKGNKTSCLWPRPANCRWYIKLHKRLVPIIGNACLCQRFCYVLLEPIRGAHTRCSWILIVFLCINNLHMGSDQVNSLGIQNWIRDGVNDCQNAASYCYGLVL